MNIVEVLKYLMNKITHADAMAPRGNPFDPDILHHQLEIKRPSLPVQRKKKNISTYVWVEKPSTSGRREFGRSVIKARKLDDGHKKAP